MSGNKKLIPVFRLKEGKAWLEDEILSENPAQMCRSYSDSGADMIIIMEDSLNDEEHEKAIACMKEMNRVVDIPLMVGGHIHRTEDVKKYLYTGAKYVFFYDTEENMRILKECSNRFGRDKMAVYTDDLSDAFSYTGDGAGLLFYFGNVMDHMQEIKACPLPLILPAGLDDAAAVLDLLKLPMITGVSMWVHENETDLLMELKHVLKSEGVEVNTFESSMDWSEFKLGSDGLLPVIVQDYKTDEVLMQAYMNEAAFRNTLHTGKMTYYSRSRQTQWVKGETSGHYQFVKSLFLDCDNDTLLAKVSQVGAACHTGARSCFFKQLVKKEYDETNPLKVFEEVFSVILERKKYPKEGSYTNYLFDKGIDKILKKVGEEATEIVIAAKNPDNEELVYEISDFLYHVMVLMAERGVNWEDITRELANR